jgi:hypothetical protein
MRLPYRGAHPHSAPAAPLAKHVRIVCKNQPDAVNPPFRSSVNAVEGLTVNQRGVLLVCVPRRVVHQLPRRWRPCAKQRLFASEIVYCSRWGGVPAMRTFIVAFATALGKYDCFQPSLEAMQRRNFIAGLSSAFWGAATRAEQFPAARKIGLLMPSRANDPYGQRQLKIFSFALNQLGWIDGQNVVLMIRWSGGEPRLAKQYANELVDLATRRNRRRQHDWIGCGSLGDQENTDLVCRCQRSRCGRLCRQPGKTGSDITGFASFDLKTAGSGLRF